MTAGRTPQTPGMMIISGQQDNGTISTSADSPLRWKRIRAGDGGFVGMLPAGFLVSTITDDPPQPANIGYPDSEKYSVIPKKDEVINHDLPNPPKGLALVRAQMLPRPWPNTLTTQFPFPRNLYAVGFPSDKADRFLYGLVGIEGSANWDLYPQWMPLADLDPVLGDQKVTALAAEEGGVYVGTDAGRLFVAILSWSDFGEPILGQQIAEFANPVPADDRGPINAIFGEFHRDKWAIAQNKNQTGSRVLRLSSIHWSDITSNLDEHGPAAGIGPTLYAVTARLGVVFVASDTKVYRTENDGSTWVDISRGLPRRFHGSDLIAFATNASELLCLGTYGRGVWRTELG